MTKLQFPHIQRVTSRGTMDGARKSLLLEAEQYLSILRGFILTDVYPIGMSILRVALVTLNYLEVLTLQQGDLMLMMDMGNGLKGLHLTARDVVVNMTLHLVQNIHTLQG